MKSRRGNLAIVSGCTAGKSGNVAAHYLGAGAVVEPGGLGGVPGNVAATGARHVRDRDDHASRCVNDFHASVFQKNHHVGIVGVDGSDRAILVMRRCAQVVADNVSQTANRTSVFRVYIIGSLCRRRKGADRARARSTAVAWRGMYEPVVWLTTGSHCGSRFRYRDRQVPRCSPSSHATLSNRENERSSKQTADEPKHFGAGGDH